MASFLLDPVRIRCRYSIPQIRLISRSRLMNRRRSPHAERPVSARRVLVLASLFLLLAGLAAPALAGRLGGKSPGKISDPRDLRIGIQSVDTHRTWTVT